MKVWKACDIYLLDGAVVPDPEGLKAPDDLSEKGLELWEEAVQKHRDFLDEVKRLHAGGDSRVAKLSYEVSAPTYGEYMAAEDAARVMVGGSPLVNTTKRDSYLMQDCVRESGDQKPLGPSGVAALGVQVAMRLSSVLHRATFPEVDSLVFP